jgi:hypothetical protein
MTSAAAASVIVLAYQSRDRIDGALRALRAQDLAEPFEVLLVDSGTDGCAEYVRACYPEVQVLQSRVRLRPGPARNHGVRAARGDVIAFLPDDGQPRSDWLRRRLDLHRCGFDLVGGAIVNGLPSSYIARAEHLLEYSSLVPIDALLNVQAVPHCLSFRRSVFDILGFYPEDTFTGEDTLFNRRCVEAQMTLAVSSEIQMAHLGNTSIVAVLQHGYQHGRGLMQCTHHHHLGSVIGDPHNLWECALRALVIYPAVGLVAKVLRFWRFAPRLLWPLAAASPVIYVALLATGLGALIEWRHGRRQAPVSRSRTSRETCAERREQPLKR